MAIEKSPRASWDCGATPGEFAIGEDVAGVRECWHPTPILQPRVPADVVGVQMDTHHIIDIPDRNAGRRQCRYVGLVGLHMPTRSGRSVLVVANAAINQHHMVGRPHEVRLKAEDQLAGCRLQRGRLQDRCSSSTSGVRSSRNSMASIKGASLSTIRWIVMSPIRKLSGRIPHSLSQANVPSLSIGVGMGRRRHQHSR